MKISIKNLKISVLLIITSVGVFNLASCVSNVAMQNKQLDYQKNALNKAANSKTMKPEQKADLLLEQYLETIEQVVQSPKPVKQKYFTTDILPPKGPPPISTNPIAGAKIVSVYIEQNQADIDKIVADCNTWVSSLNTAQVKELGLRLDKKPYMKAYMELMPKFKKKYSQYKSIMETTRKVLTVYGKDGKLATFDF